MNNQIKKNIIVIDPVCGMKKSTSEFQYAETHQGKTVHFCSHQCKDTFKKFPDRYIQVVTNFENER